MTRKFHRVVRGPKKEEVLKGFKSPVEADKAKEQYFINHQVPKEQQGDYSVEEYVFTMKELP